METNFAEILHMQPIHTINPNATKEPITQQLCKLSGDVRNGEIDGIARFLLNPDYHKEGP